jgi:hypothetical protein
MMPLLERLSKFHSTLAEMDHEETEISDADPRPRRRISSIFAPCCE